MAGVYFVCQVCRKSYENREKEGRMKEKKEICPVCGREMREVQFFLWK